MSIAFASPFFWLYFLTTLDYCCTQTRKVRAVLDAGGPVEIADRDNMHVLHHAVRQGDVGIVLLVFKHGFAVKKAKRWVSVVRQDTDPD